MSYRLLMPLILLIAATALVGCSYTPARIDAEPLVEFGDRHDHGHDRHRQGGGFCPPGLAKQGRC
ncbi:hypothetical protein ACGTN6_10735 [Halomonas sp. THAF12]|uniref:hypothetical protein n=1 Tax=Halomonas sp. B23F22_10 TaxID=3459515 RepID=UPI00373E0EF3